jgi:hypothetical protein
MLTLSKRHVPPVLGKEIEAAPALEKKAERARQTRKADKSQLSVAFTYYHPLDPLPNPIDHLAIINFGCNPHIL